MSSPALPVGLGEVPGLADRLLVWRARRARRLLRIGSRLVAAAAATGAVVVVAATVTAPALVMPRCAARASLARTLLGASVADGGWIGPDAPQRDASGLVARAGDGVRVAVTDIVQEADGLRLLVWAFVEGDDDGARGAFVIDTAGRLTTVVDPCVER